MDSAGLYALFATVTQHKHQPTLPDCTVLGVVHVGSHEFEDNNTMHETDNQIPQGHTGEQGPAMIREDHQLLAELAQLNTDMASLGMCIMDGTATGAEQRHYAERLIAAGERLRRRANGRGHTVIEGDLGEVCEQLLALPPHTVEPAAVDREL